MLIDRYFPTNTIMSTSSSYITYYNVLTSSSDLADHPRAVNFFITWPFFFQLKTKFSGHGYTEPYLGLVTSNKVTSSFHDKKSCSIRNKLNGFC